MSASITGVSIRFIRGAMILLLAQLVLACSQSLDWAAEPGWGDEVDRWLNCTECDDGELAAVVDLGGPVITRLGNVLADGPDATAIAAVRRDLGIEYDGLSVTASAAGATLPRSRSEYIDLYLSHFDARQRLRAVTALQTIGGVEARNTLRAVVLASLQPNVAQRVSDALSAMGN